MLQYLSSIVLNYYDIHMNVKALQQPEFVNREAQVQELHALAERAGPSLALLYGRRRVGKTFLLDRLWEEDRRFYFLAADTTPEQNRRDLLRDLADWSRQELRPEDYPTWRTVFRLLAGLADDRPIVVVLDEFQYLMGSEEGVVSQLNAVWDREVQGRNLTLILCGSEVSTMAALAAGDSPLYGRINWRERLRPFDYFDAARMFPAWPRRDHAYGYGVFGGTPQYLAAIDPADAFDEAMRSTVLSARGEVHLQLENLIEQEKGIRSPGEYRAVLTAVAGGHTEISQVADAAGLGDRRYVAKRALETLEALELIHRERNFKAGRTTPWRFRIADNAVRFWYRFVHPNRSQLETGEAARVWVQRIQPQLDTYMGKVFEGMCRDAFARHHERWGLPGAVEWARWEGQDRNRRSIEIDIAAALDDGRLLTGEIKWSSSPVEYDLHLGLMRDLDDLGNSGQKWARQAVDAETSHGQLYISAAGFTNHFRKQAQRNGRIRLIALEELYVT